MKQRPLTIRKSGQQLRLTIPKSLGLEAGAEVGVIPYTKYLEIEATDVTSIINELEATKVKLAEANKIIETMKKEIAEVSLDVAKEKTDDTEEIRTLTLKNTEATKTIASLYEKIASLETEAKEEIKLTKDKDKEIATLTGKVESLEIKQAEKDKLFNTSFNSLKIIATDKVEATAKATEVKVTEEIKQQVKATGFMNRLLGKIPIETPAVAEEVVAPAIEEINDTVSYILPAGTIAEKPKIIDNVEKEVDDI